MACKRCNGSGLRNVRDRRYYALCACVLSQAGRTGWERFGYYWLAGAWLPESAEQADRRMAEAGVARRLREGP